MIRIIGKEIVRERSYAFSADIPLPRVAATLPPRLRRELPTIEDGQEELLFLRFFLQRRVASIHTCGGALAWDATAECRLQIQHSATGLLRPLMHYQPAVQPAMAAALGAADGWRSGRGPNGSISQPSARQLEHTAVALPALQGGSANEFIENGDNHSPASSKLAYPPTIGGPGTNGDSGRAGHGYVFLALLESGSVSPQIVLSADTYSLALLGRFRLLAETIAGWMGTEIEVAGSA